MLTDTKLRRIAPDGKPMKVGGVTGLYFRPGNRTGHGKFTLRFVSPTSKKRRDMGLGTYPDQSLAQARLEAITARALILKGVDPIEQRSERAQSVEVQAAIPTFASVAEEVHASICPGFKNRKHNAQWINTLRTYVYPTIGDQKVDSLTTADFARALGSVWLAKPETASRVRQRCERVMTWCLARGLVTSNPVSAVDALLPKQESKRTRVAHFPALPWRDMPATADKLFGSRRRSVGREALFFLILTAARSGEVRGATWDEIDTKDKVWTIPARRMKAGIAHRVPLSAPALRILKERAKHRHRWVFSSTGTGMISDMTLTKVLKDHKIRSDVDGRHATAHGFRSTFRDWASEKQYSRDVAERALAHTIRNQTEAAYNRTDLLDQRREVMGAWANFVCSMLEDAGSASE